MLTTRPVRAAAVSRSVCRDRNAGICRTSATSAAGRGLRRLVDVGQDRHAEPRRARARGSAGPRQPGTAERAARRAVRLVVRRLEDERHARARGRCRGWRSASLERVRLAFDHARARDEQQRRAAADRSARRPEPASRRYPTTDAAACCRAASLCAMARLDEAGEQRVRLERLRLELGMELHGDVPRMRRQLDDLDELAVVRPADDLAAPGRSASVSNRQLNS